ncbi:MAG: hypothetical protein WCA49_06555 [Candidatus Sulfotelmatobacter sp.]
MSPSRPIAQAGSLGKNPSEQSLRSPKDLLIPFLRTNLVVTLLDYFRIAD